MLAYTIKVLIFLLHSRGRVSIRLECLGSGYSVWGYGNSVYCLDGTRSGIF